MKLKFSRKKLVLLIVAVCVAAALLSLFFFSVASARSSSSQAIEETSQNIDRALLASAPGSPEEAGLQASQAELAEARQLFDGGSIFSKGNYADAEAKAREADEYAQSILDRLADEYAAADKAMSGHDFVNAFAFCKKYPHTDEALLLLDRSEEMYFEAIAMLQLDADSDVKILEETRLFDSAYPIPEVPKSITDNTGDMLVDIAVDYVYGVDLRLTADKSNLKKIETSYDKHKVWPLPDDLNAATAKANADMAQLRMPAELQQLYALMTQMQQSAAEFNSDSSSGLLYESQLARLDKLTSSLDQQTAEAKALIDTIKAKYYKGNEAAQQGFIAGARAGMKASGADL